MSSEKLIFGPAAHAVLIGVAIPAAIAATAASAAAAPMKRLLLFVIGLSLSDVARISAGWIQ
jgi:hypothetical protein